MELIFTTRNQPIIFHIDGRNFTVQERDESGCKSLLRADELTLLFHIGKTLT